MRERIRRVQPVSVIVLWIVWVASLASADTPATRQDWVVEIVDGGFAVARPATDKAVPGESQDSVFVVSSSRGLPAIKVSNINIPQAAQDDVVQRILRRTAWAHEPAWDEGSWKVLPSSDGAVVMGQSYSHQRIFAVGPGRCLLVETGFPKNSTSKKIRRELSDKLTEVVKQTIAANKLKGSTGDYDEGMRQFDQWLVQKQLEAAVGFMVDESKR